MTGVSSTPVRIRLIDLDRSLIHLEYANGNMLPVPVEYLGQSMPPTLGEVVLIDEDGDVVERNAPRFLWPRPASVGVVKAKGVNKTLIEFGSSLRQVPTTLDITYEVGHTVEADDLWGVTELVSKSSITIFDRDDEEPIENYIVKSARYESISSFGGSEELVSRARELIEVPLKYAKELEDIGAKPVKGVLFTGPPGTGKTKLAKIIARLTEATLYAVSGPQVFNKWYGASERIVRKLFEHAAEQEKAIIFFDEIDSVAGQRNDSSHEASRRVVTQLLTSMDGLLRESNVVVIATTNRPNDIDQALRRPGRFDVELKFNLPSASDRLRILEASAVDIKRTGAIPLEEIAEKCQGWSPADLSSIWTEAAVCAVVDGRNSIRSEDVRRGHLRVAETRTAKASKEKS